MAQLTNPEAIRFSNEQIRPLCERARALKAEVAALQTDWFGGVNTLFANGSDTVEDGRTAEGVSRLTAANVTNAVSNLLAAAAALDDAVVSLPCVRALKAE